MIISSCTSPEPPSFALACWQSQQGYAARIGHEFTAHTVSRALGDFEHRNPILLEHDDDLMLYLEWDVFVERDAGNLFDMMGDHDIMLPQFTIPGLPDHPLNGICRALRFPWHILGVMLVRRRILAKLEEIRRNCHPYAATMPTPQAAYECTYLMAIQQGGFKLGTFPPHVHRLHGDPSPAWFRHFEGKSKSQILSHAAAHS